MCGRFALSAKTKDIEKLLPELKISQPTEPRYNIAPSQNILAAIVDGEQYSSKEFKWGLVPFWAKDSAIGNKMINARSETIAEKPSFRNAFNKRRCVIFTDGFYEWRRSGKTKTPYFIHLKSGKPFAFAGLWERWDKESEPLETATIVTTTPNELMKPIHNRMPVILDSDMMEKWMAPMDKKELLALLQPFDSAQMEAYEVSTIVNNPANDVPDCIQPVSDRLL